MASAISDEIGELPKNSVSSETSPKASMEWTLWPNSSRLKLKNASADACIKTGLVRCGRSQTLWAQLARCGRSWSTPATRLVIPAGPQESGIPRTGPPAAIIERPRRSSRRRRKKSPPHCGAYRSETPRTPGYIRSRRCILCPQVYLVE